MRENLVNLLARGANVQVAKIVRPNGSCVSYKLLALIIYWSELLVDFVELGF